MAILVGSKEVDERVFLFRGKRGANAHHHAVGAAGIYEDLFRAIHRLEGHGRLLGVGHFFGDLLLDGGELSGGDDCCGMIAALDLTLIGALEGGVNGDDLAGARYL